MAYRVHLKLFPLVNKTLSNQAPKFEEFLHAHSITAYRVRSINQGLVKVSRTNRPISKMAAENSNKLKLPKI